MKGIILYKSKYGATLKYAEWLSAETGFDVCSVEKAKVQDIEIYDVIILSLIHI